MRFIIYPFLLLIILNCNSIRVFSDFDRNVDFSNYQNFSFYKSGIDQVLISDLDKNRIINSIKSNLDSLGIKENSNSDILVNFNVDATNQIIINNGLHYNYGYSPYYWGYNYGYNSYYPFTSSRIKGELIIDFIDAKTKRLVWQGIGHGFIDVYMKDRDKQINNFVKQIINKYPN